MRTLFTLLLAGCTGDETTDTSPVTSTSTFPTDGAPDTDTGTPPDTDTTTDTGSVPCEPVAEVCNGVDDDCDGLVDDDDDEDLGDRWFPDADSDGYGDDAGGVRACVAPPAYLADGGDCDDGDGAVHPGAPEICDRVDTDCDGLFGDAPDPCEEGFEGIGDGNLQTPFAFASGVRLVEPNPNRGDSFGVIVVDCVDGGGFFGFSCDAGVPSGTAALGNANLGLFHDLRFVFPDPAGEVSIAVASSGSDPDTVFSFTAYDAGGVVVDSTSGGGVVSTWATNRLTLSGIGITEVVLTGDGSGSLLADGLSWR